MRYSKLSAAILVLIGVSAVQSSVSLNADDRNVLILSPQDKSFPWFRIDELVSSFESKGYRVQVVYNSAVSVDMLKTALRQYKIVLFRTILVEFHHVVWWLTGETVQDGKYTEDIQSGRVAATDWGYYGIASRFVEKYYPAGSLTGKLVYFFASRSLMLASTFISGGTDVIIGYGSVIPLQWGYGDTLTYHLFNALLNGATVSDAVKLVRGEATGRNQEPTVPENFRTIDYVGNGARSLT